ncbi:surface lipoprotein assembly modifier [Actinobacillus vicugnae]|uniref:surface lipoprotein assembly modifier n=1 Tax=Actinobacillus vicugnae TaxID=2573093 RepID=UPI001241FFE9|nr:surface lipoprotein assembly modifier [Actinobacillus vicugnae]
MKKTLLLLPIFSSTAFAENVIEHNTDPIVFEPQQQAVKFEQNFAKKAQKITAYQTQISGKSIEQQINQAIVSQNWQQLDILLNDYAKQPNQDPLLLDYGLAALAYGQKDHQLAIFHYRSLLAKQPDLLYPHFDLALVLAENQQYRDAEQAFNKIASKLPADLKNIAERTKAQIAEQENWQHDVYLQYTQTDNVNNAATSPTVNVNGRIFHKNKESLPQSAKGLRYGLGLSKKWNIVGNHFVGIALNYNGVYYWDNHDYSEQSLSVSPQYSYRQANYRVSFSPFIEQNWLSSSRYNYQFGTKLNGLRILNDRWLLSGGISHSQKRYFEPLLAHRYNGYKNQLEGSLQWQAVKNWRFFANAQASREITREKAQSSNKWLVRIGAIYQTNSWAVQANVAFGKRYFADNHYLFGYKRQDKEYQGNLAIWNRAWHYKGIVPKLNFRYQKIDSNIADFYSRRNQEVFMTLEKLF